MKTYIVLWIILSNAAFDLSLGKMKKRWKNQVKEKTQKSYKQNIVSNQSLKVSTSPLFYRSEKTKHKRRKKSKSIVIYFEDTQKSHIKNVKLWKDSLKYLQFSCKFVQSNDNVIRHKLVWVSVWLCNQTRSRIDRMLRELLFLPPHKMMTFIHSHIYPQFLHKTSPQNFISPR